MGAVNTGLLTSNSLEKASLFFRVLITRPRREGPGIGPSTVQRRGLKFREAGGWGVGSEGRLPAGHPANANLSTHALGPRSTLHDWRKISWERPLSLA